MGGIIMLIHKKRGLTVLALLIACAVSLHTASASDIYRWVDENGQTHISDTVPARYKNSARKVDTSASKVSKEQRAAALQRAEEVKKAAAARALTPGAAPTTVPPAPSPPASPEGYSLEPDANAKRNNPDDADCARLRREYEESQACFVQFATQTGIKGEAYDHCQSVPDPTPRCGLTTN